MLINIKVAGTEESHSLLPERLRAYEILPDQLLSFDFIIQDAEEDGDDVTSDDENYLLSSMHDNWLEYYWIYFHS